MEIVVRPIEPDRIVDLRHAVLRAGYGRDSAIFAGDTDPGSYHVAAVIEDVIIGCATLHRERYDDAWPLAWRLRGMAVDAQYRKSGIGHRLLTAIESHARQTDYSPLLWCNARTPAVPFYRRAGWEIVSDEFDIPTAGPHFRMLKRLDNLATAVAKSV